MNTGRGPGRRVRIGLGLLALAVLTALVGGTNPLATDPPAVPAAPAAPAAADPSAEAAPSSEVAAERAVDPVYRTDGVDGRRNTYASQVSGAHIWDLEVIGNTIYVAGKFTQVVVARGSWPRIGQPFLAAFDTETGRWRTGWRPRVNRPVYALDTLPSGSIVAAGEFTRANGSPAASIVALHPTTGATDRRFVAGVRRPGSPHFAVVRDLHLKGNRLYGVGNFTRAFGPGGRTLMVEKAVRFDARSGAPDPAWRPRLVGRSAYAVAVSTDGRRVHLGGEFSSVNGNRGTSQLATVSARNGRLLRGWRHGSNAPRWPTWPVGGVVFDLDVHRASLYVAGAEHYWERRDSRTGRSMRFQRISNDSQSVDVVGNRVYIGCHCFHRDRDRQVWEVNARNGRPLPGRTRALQSGDGTWATAVARDGCLWLGGDFNMATTVVGLGRGSFWVGRLARLCPSGGPERIPVPEAGPGPVNPPWWTPPPG